MKDFHMHTKHSDGYSTVAELLDYINGSDINLFSITDHNSINAYLDPEFNRCNKDYILGCEVCATHEHIGIEVLAYGFDLDVFKQNDFLAPDYLKSMQAKTYQTLLDKAKALNLTVLDEPMDKYHLFAHVALLRNLQASPENHDFLNQYGYVLDKTFFRLSSKEGAHFKVPSVFPELKDMVDRIHQAGGKAVLAHPYMYHGVDDIYEFVKSAYENAGIDGVEVFYPFSDVALQQRLLAFCEEHSLITSCGSDYHRGGKEYIGSTYDARISLPFSVPIHTAEVLQCL